MVEKARQGLLLFLEVFYDSTKAMVCPVGGDKSSEILFLEDGIKSPKHAQVETLVSVADQKMMQFVHMINTIIGINVIEKIKLSYQHLEFPE